jgi:hypothetical protein
MDQSRNPFNYFNGWMDELRIWKVELTVEQIRQMMNKKYKTMEEMSRSNVPLNIQGLTD